MRIGLSISNSAQRIAYYSLISDFEIAHPDIKIKVTAFTSEVYKEKFPTLLSTKSFDILYWHAGQRLYEFIQQQQVASISNLYQKEKLFEIFDTSVISSISTQEEVYALPTSYYQIGFYYNVSLFNKLGLVKPDTWKQFLNICDQLKANNITPIFIGTKSNWPATAWFDYLNLRINGLDYHRQLLSGNVSFLDPKVRQVFTNLKLLVDSNYFISNHKQYSWKEGIAPLFRGVTGMAMFGNYAMQDFPQNNATEIGYFKFPMFDENQTQYFEEVPLDVLLIPSNSDQKHLAEVFLKFAAQSENQQRLNQVLGVMSPNKFAQVNNLALAQQAYEIISNASGITQFFDRDANSHFAENVMPIIDDFLTNPDINSTLSQLEKVRLNLFP